MLLFQLMKEQRIIIIISVNAHPFDAKDCKQEVKV